MVSNLMMAENATEMFPIFVGEASYCSCESNGLEEVCREVAKSIDLRAIEEELQHATYE
jgi:hypothetical protein